MKLRKYHCDDLFIRLTTHREKFFSEKFFRDPRLSEDAESWGKGAPLEFLHYTNNTRLSDYHVHTYLARMKQDVNLALNWSEGVVRKTRSSSYPFAEDVHEWIQEFFKKHVYPVRVSAYYLFPHSAYVSSVGLPMPFWVPSQRRGRRTILGIRVSADLRGAEDATVLTDVHQEHILVALSVRFKARLSQMKPDSLLKKFNPLVLEFVKER